jgi:hypothetical protein
MRQCNEDTRHYHVHMIYCSHMREWKIGPWNFGAEQCCCETPKGLNIYMNLNLTSRSQILETDIKMSSLSRRACYKCGNVGHYAEVCSSSERLCYNCKQPGESNFQPYCETKVLTTFKAMRATRALTRGPPRVSNSQKSE